MSRLFDEAADATRAAALRKLNADVVADTVFAALFLLLLLFWLILVELFEFELALLPKFER